MPRCSNCAFYVAEKKDEVGECHRYPPTLLPEDSDVAIFTFPITAEDEWCGEFVRFTN
jgi:hypothetical protein